MKKTGACFILFLSLWTQNSLVSADQWKTDKESGCRFEIPSTWQVNAVQWVGACVNGKADGLGVLRYYNHGKLGELFFGRIQAGILRVGVIDTPEGYVAGQFSDGKVEKNEDRNVTISAFREASGAAKSASTYYQKHSNEASAHYYTDKAKDFDNQLD